MAMSTSCQPSLDGVLFAGVRASVDGGVTSSLGVPVAASTEPSGTPWVAGVQSAHGVIEGVGVGTPCVAGVQSELGGVAVSAGTVAVSTGTDSVSTGTLSVSTGWLGRLGLGLDRDALGLDRAPTRTRLPCPRRCG